MLSSGLTRQPHIQYGSREMKSPSPLTGSSSESITALSESGTKASRDLPCSLPASLTAECALSLPLFFLTFLMLFSLMDAGGNYAAAAVRLSNRAREAACAASLADLPSEWIDLTETYTVSFPVTILPGLSLRLPLRARVRIWRGEDGSSGAGSAEGMRIVYLTEYASVYHLYADCTHLSLAVYETDTSSVGALRNAYGRPYRKCDGFPAGYRGPVYVTEKGDCYYPDMNDPALTRHVRIVSADDAEGLPLCARCAARSGS